MAETRAGYTSRWCICRHSIRPSSTGVPARASSPGRSAGSFSRKWPRAASTGRPRTAGANCGSGGQQSDEPIPPDRKDNLYEPVAGDHGMHGRFDAEAVAWSWELWIATHPWIIAGLIIVLVHLFQRILTRQST